MPQVDESTFFLSLPDNFEIVRDEERIQCVSREPVGVLSLTPEEVHDPEHLPNLSRMLAGFLTRSGHPVATDELLRITTVPDAHGFSWHYSENGNAHRFWLMGNRDSWLLLTFVCPAANMSVFHEPLQEVIKTVRLKGKNSAP